MTVCKKEGEYLQDLIERGITSGPLWDFANFMLAICLNAARLEFDQMIWEREMARLKEEWELLPAEEVKPWPLPCDMRSAEVRGQIFADPQKAMIFSEAVAEAFQKAGIELEDNETFACLVCVVPRSRYVSEVIGPAFLEAGPKSSALTYITGPEEMSAIFKVMPDLPG
jgi:hypothetical protein